MLQCEYVTPNLSIVATHHDEALAIVSKTIWNQGTDQGDTMKNSSLKQTATLSLCAALTVLFGIQQLNAGEVNFGERTPSVHEFVDALTPQLRFRGIRPVTATQAPVEAGPAKATMQLQFEFDSARLTQASKLSLDNLSEALKTDQLSSFRFVIQGHTDAMGAEHYNQTLSERRATAVKRYLVDRHQVSGDRLEIVGLGERELLNPLNPFDASNRRVAILNVGQ